MSYSNNILIAKLPVPNVGFDKHAKLSTGICVRSSALRPSINGMKSKVNQVIWPTGKKRQRQGPCHRDDTAISSCFCHVFALFRPYWELILCCGLYERLCFCVRIRTGATFLLSLLAPVTALDTRRFTDHQSAVQSRPIQFRFRSRSGLSIDS